MHFAYVIVNQNGPKRYDGEVNDVEIYSHLVKSGISRRRMTPPKHESDRAKGHGEFLSFVERMISYDKGRNELIKAYKEATSGEETSTHPQVEQRVWVDCRLLHWPIAEGRPLMRTKIALAEGSKVFFGKEGYVRAVTTPAQSQEAKDQQREQHKQKQKQKDKNVHNPGSAGRSTRRR